MRNVGCRHGLCAFLCEQCHDRNAWDYDADHLCCCEKLLKLFVTADWTFSLSPGRVRPAWEQEAQVMPEWCRAVTRPPLQCVTLASSCVCRDALPCQGTTVPACELTQTPPHLPASSPCAEVPKGFRSPPCWGVPGAVWILGCPVPAMGTAGLEQAVTLLFLQERLFRECWEKY